MIIYWINRKNIFNFSFTILTLYYILLHSILTMFIFLILFFISLITYTSLSPHPLYFNQLINIYLFSETTPLAIFCGVCLALYGASCLNNGILTPMSLNGPGGLLTWAFFLAIVATALAFVVALLFGIDAMIQSKKIRTNE